MGIRKLPIGIQSFEDLRCSGYLYVDKTRYVWELVETGKSYGRLPEHQALRVFALSGS